MNKTPEQKTRDHIDNLLERPDGFLLIGNPCTGALARELPYGNIKPLQLDF